jgi:Flp pilus assembly pilin Flp
MMSARFSRNQIVYSLKGGEKKMELLKRLVKEEEGQGLVEYTLVVLLVALVFWLPSGTQTSATLANSWAQVVPACIPLTCG